MRSKGVAYEVTLIMGDGTGPELAEAARHCVDATGVKINWDRQEAGIDVMERCGTPLPDALLASIRRTRCALKAPITTPVGKGFRSVNVQLRHEFGLFACVRPCKHYPGVRTFFEKVPIDLVIVRENTEDLYLGMEFEAGRPDTMGLIDFCNRITPAANRKIQTPRDGTGVSIKPISIVGTEQIVRYAFEYARANNRRKVTAVHKANIMKHTDGLFLRRAQQVAEEYPDIPFEDRIVDNMCMQLVQKPELYDVLVLPNLYGDIISDVAAGLVGGLGVAPGANIGHDTAIFEATHGSAPKYKGQNKVNPAALVLSGALMLRHLKEVGAAECLERAVAATIAEGKCVTYDLKPHRDDPTAVGTREMAAAICRKLEEAV
jgi:isocitrate dehydrogenase (NAD+)